MAIHATVAKVTARIAARSAASRGNYLEQIRAAALSAKVLKARTQGPFKNWNDLMQRVSGIRQNKATQFSEQGLTVNGQAFSAKPEM